ncbi:hypothetical protein [Paraglaciecola marina]|uniref:hypothetical protein n=1 Tax=Paraglaciecola marina TaxID=2500157 RepID=UPI0014150FDB|nr:hypothetical protein [Paraglaciecola marina]
MNNKNKKEDRVFAVNYSQVDPKTDQNTQLALAKMELTYAIIGQVLGLVCILGGIA